MTKNIYELRLIVKAMLVATIMSSVKEIDPNIKESEYEDLKNTAWSLFVKDNIDKDIE